VARAFLVAGVPSVIATLSDVEDRGVAPFFVELHRRLASGLEPAEALRATQLEWIRRGSPDGDLWASVESIGN
jgi:CHAT domain-containing protein